jgi:polyhydroxyalkanoate synthesis regulator phasin
MADLGSSHLSSLLEAVPGIASVLRSPVADALLRTIRAAAGLADYSADDATELVRYAVRRGLVGADEGDKVLAELTAAKRQIRRPAGKKAPRVTARKSTKPKVASPKSKVNRSAARPAARPTSGSKSKPTKRSGRR